MVQPQAVRRDSNNTDIKQIAGEELDHGMS